MNRLFEEFGSPEGFQVIDGGIDARKKYGYAYGSSGVVITEEDIQALREGKQLVYDGGEYNTFVMLEINPEFPYGRCECGRSLSMKKICSVCDNDE